MVEPVSLDLYRSAPPIPNEPLGEQPQEGGGLQFDDGDGTYGSMESRVTKLETHMEYVRRDLDDIRADLKTTLGVLKDLPTKRDLDTWRWQWLATGLAIIALTVGGITGGLALIARFTG